MMSGLVAEGEGEEESHSKVGTLWVRQSLLTLKSKLTRALVGFCKQVIFACIFWSERKTWIGNTLNEIEEGSF